MCPACYRADMCKKKKSEKNFYSPPLQTFIALPLKVPLKKNTHTKTLKFFLDTPWVGVRCLSGDPQGIYGEEELVSSSDEMNPSRLVSSGVSATSWSPLITNQAPDGSNFSSVAQTSGLQRGMWVSQQQCSDSSLHDSATGVRSNKPTRLIKQSVGKFGRVCMNTRCVNITTYALVRRWVSFGRLFIES